MYNEESNSFILRLPVEKLKAVNWLRISGFAAIIATIVLLALWAISGIDRDPEPHLVEEPDVPASPLATAGWETHLTFCERNEFFAPATLPWSLSNIKRLPGVEVLSVRLITEKIDATAPPPVIPMEGEVVDDETTIPDTAVETEDIITDRPFAPDPDVDYKGLISDAVAFRVPPLFRPFELKSSPPYLVTPAVVEFDFYIGPEGEVTKCSVRSEDISPELQEQVTERAYRLRFPSALAFADFNARVRVLPYTYNRLVVERSGKPVADEEYRLAFRTLLYSSYYLTVAMQGGEGELLMAETGKTITFAVDMQGKPFNIAVNPVILDPAASEAVISAVSYIHFPGELVGSRITITLGAS